MQMREIVSKAERGLTVTDLDGQKRDISGAVGRALQEAAEAARKNMCPNETCQYDLRETRVETVKDGAPAAFCSHCGYWLDQEDPT